MWQLSEAGVVVVHIVLRNKRVKVSAFLVQYNTWLHINIGYIALFGVVQFSS